MTRPRSEFLGTLGKLMQIAKKVADKVLELGGTDESIAAIDTDDRLARNIALLITFPIRAWTTEDQQRVLLAKLFSKVREIGGSEEDFDRLTTDPKLLENVAHCLRDRHTIEKGRWMINFSGNRIVSANSKGCHIRVQGLGHHAVCAHDRPFEITLSDTGITCTYLRHDLFYEEFYSF